MTKCSIRNHFTAKTCASPSINMDGEAQDMDISFSYFLSPICDPNLTPHYCLVSRNLSKCLEMQNVSNQFMRNRLHNRSILYVQIVAMQWKEYLGSRAYRDVFAFAFRQTLNY